MDRRARPSWHRWSCTSETARLEIDAAGLAEMEAREAIVADLHRDEWPAA